MESIDIGITNNTNTNANANYHPLPNSTFRPSTSPCAHCGQSFLDPNVPHLCSAVKAVLDQQRKNDHNASLSEERKKLTEAKLEAYLASASASASALAPTNNADMSISFEGQSYSISDPAGPSTSSLNPAASSFSSTSTAPITAKADKPASLSSSISSSHLATPTAANIEVLVRVRPLLPHEQDGRSATSIITCSPDGRTVSIAHPSKSLQCAYDTVFPSTVTQEDVYAKVASACNALVAGFNATIFAYGQTGSGKTHTMFGPSSDSYAVQRSPYGTGAKHAVLQASAGVIPRSIVAIFKALGRKDLGIASCTVYCSFVQVYNEQLYDMLRDPRRSSALEIHEEPGQGVYVAGLSEYAVRNAGDCLALVKLGEENRAIRETHMNTASSRSHSLFQIVVEQTRVEEGAEGERQLKSKFNLVDLAGSEKWDTKRDRETHVERSTDRDTESKAKAFSEAHVSEMTNINLSLYTLGRCIAALAKSAKRLKNDVHALAEHVPFRESKLTRLLQDSLGGNAKTMLIATLSPASDCLEETISTLRFADRAHQVMTFVRLNEKRPVDHALVQRLQSEVKRLRALLEEGGVEFGGPDKNKNDNANASVSAPAMAGLAGSALAAVMGATPRKGEAGPAELSAALEKVAFLRVENNTLRRRLGMAEVKDDDGGAPRPRPTKFPIVGGGNSEEAMGLRQSTTFITSNGSDADTNANESLGLVQANIAEVLGSHSRLSNIMVDFDRVTSSFFTFTIEEEQLKDGVMKIMRLFKKEKKAYSEMYSRMENKAADDGTLPTRAKNGKSEKVAVSSQGHASSSRKSNTNMNMNGPSAVTSSYSHGASSPSGFALQGGGKSKGPANAGGFNPSSIAATTNAAASLGVAYRIREKGRTKRAGDDNYNDNSNNGGDGSKSSSNLLASGSISAGNLAGSSSASSWIHNDEEDEELILRKELKAAKSRMKKQVQMQEWLEKKESKAYAALESEELMKKGYEEEEKRKNRAFRGKAKRQKKKLERYYARLREEVEGLGGNTDNGDGNVDEESLAMSVMSESVNRGGESSECED